MFKRFTKSPFGKEPTSGPSTMTADPSRGNLSRPKPFPSNPSSSSYISNKDEFSIPPRIFTGDEMTMPPRVRTQNLNSEVLARHEEAMTAKKWGEDFSSKPQERAPAPQFRPEEPETTLGEGVEFKGELYFDNYICINGCFEGVLKSKGKVHVGPRGKIKANIELREAIIEGRVEGNITAERVELRGEAKVYGDIISRSLSVDEGACIVGQVMVTPSDDNEIERPKKA